MKNTAYLNPKPDSRPRIFAHRGFTYRNNSQVLDENTLAAFENALAEGADYLETDVRVTKDDVPVLFHDADLRRTLGRIIEVKGITFAELKAITLPYGGTVSSLEEALNTFPEARFNIDIKTSAAELAAAKVVNSLKAHDRVLISSFSASSRKRTLLNLDSPVATSPGRIEVINIYFKSRVGMISATKKQIEEFSALQIPVTAVGIDFLNVNFLDAVLQTTTELHYWTVNDPKTMTLVHSLGAHGIVTDRTDIAKKVFA